MQMLSISFRADSLYNYYVYVELLKFLPPFTKCQMSHAKFMNRMFSCYLHVPLLTKYTTLYMRIPAGCGCIVNQHSLYIQNVKCMYYFVFDNQLIGLIGQALLLLHTTSTSIIVLH